VPVDDRQFDTGIDIEGKLHVELIISGRLDRTGEGVEDVESSGPTFSLSHGHAGGVQTTQMVSLSPVYLSMAAFIKARSSLRMSRSHNIQLESWPPRPVCQSKIAVI
jgi:hypothetical protein